MTHVPLLLAGLAVLIVFSLAVLLRKRPERVTELREDALPYRCKEAVLTPPERAFLATLRLAVPDRITILSKVRFADLLYIPHGTANSHGAFNKIVAKHADFVLCDAQTFAPRLVIELDDASHRMSKRQSSDSFKDRACATAGLPLLRIPVQGSYDRASLTTRICNVLKQDA